MSAAAKGTLVFGAYLVLTGATFAIIPNPALELLGQASTDDPWIRVLGVITGVLGVYYLWAARAEATGFFWTTVWMRLSIPILFGALVLLADAPVVLMAFALFDVFGALYTWRALAKTSSA